MKKIILLVAVLAVATRSAWGAGASVSSMGAAADESPSQQLNRLFEQYHEERMALYPALATLVGDHRYDDRLGNPLSAEHRAREALLVEKYSRELAGIDRAGLSPQEQLSHEVFGSELARTMTGLKFPQHWLPIGDMFDPPTVFALLASGDSIQPFKTVKDYDNFLGRARDFSIIAATAIGNMRKGMAAGVMQPRVIVEKSVKQMEALLVPDPKQSLFYRPILKMPAGFGATEKARLERAYLETIQKEILPAYRRLVSFIRRDYLPRCRETVGLSALPRGKEWYEHWVRHYTTTALTPEQIHELGNAEVARITGEMEALKAKLGFTGGLAAFAKHLDQTTASYRTKDELVQAYTRLRTVVEPRLPMLFGQQPKGTYEIRPVEEFREKTSQSQLVPGTPDGSRASVFYVNAAGIEQTPMAISEALFLHEAVPGHHFQIAISYEQQELPKFRRFGGYDAYAEGWALYAERLGPELGCYRDAKQHLDFLASEMFRARRLVVDVGLHLKGWSRNQALRYLLEIPGFTEADAVLEVDRYIGWPGQALSYKCGQLKISALRAEAETVLGTKFDARKFHDELLKDGALPLSVLEGKLRRWIAAGGN